MLDGGERMAVRIWARSGCSAVKNALGRNHSSLAWPTKHIMELASVEVWAFKMSRKRSTLKHTGIVLQIAVGGYTERWVHEVTGGSGFGLDSSRILLGEVEEGPNAKSVLIHRIEQPEDVESYEESYKIAEFKCNHPTARSFLTGKLFRYEWKYNLLFANCRDHVLYFMGVLRKENYVVSPEVEAWVRTIKVKDAAIGLVGVAGAVAAGALVFSGIWSLLSAMSAPQPDDQDDDDQ